MRSVISTLFTIALLAGQWRVYQKMGRRGWEGIIPFYNWYVLCEELYNNGNKMWFLLIPFYNIYVLIRYMMDLAVRFRRSAGFGVGLALLAPIFWCILGFGRNVYLDGRRAVKGTDPISGVLDSIAEAVQNSGETDAR